MENLCDNGAERAVLAGLLQYGSEAYVEVHDVLSENSFASTGNQVIYKCLKRVIEAEQEVDLPAILSAAEGLNLLDVIQTEQELSYIKSLSNFFVNKTNVFSFAIQVKKFEYARSICMTADNIKETVSNINGSESIDDIINILERPVEEFVRRGESTDKTIMLGGGVLEYLAYLEENPCDLVGIPTHFKHYDEAIGGGLRRKTVNLIAARPKTGKSVFGDAVAVNAALDGTPTLMLDTEMSKEDHINRILASLSGVPIKMIETGKFAEDPDNKAKVIAAGKQLEELPYHYISVAGKSFSSILNIVKRWVMHEVGQDEEGNTNDCLLVFDYLKMMSAEGISGNIQEYQVLGFQITALHDLCVKLDIPCLAFVQLNRDGISKESTDAVSGSDRLVWLCTSCTIFKNKSEEEIAQDGTKNGNRKAVVLAARHGPGLVDGNYINMNMVGDQAKLLEIGLRNDAHVDIKNDTGLISEEDLDEIKADGSESA